MGFRRKMSAVRRVAVPTQKEAFVIWALSVRGVGESATSEEEPTQDKACNLGRFLDSLRSLGMTYRQVVPFIRTGCIRRVPGTAHRPFPTVSLVGGSINHTGYIRNVAGVKPFIHTGTRVIFATLPERHRRFSGCLPPKTKFAIEPGKLSAFPLLFVNACVMLSLVPPAPRQAVPLDFFGGDRLLFYPRSHRKGVADMVTWSELFQFGMFLVAVIALVFQVNNKEK